MYLEMIQEPNDVKGIQQELLPDLAKEIRNVLLQKLSIHGGHIGSNLGLVELTIALHYVFMSPVDKIVFDVSHQSYVHKMLTGRATAFLNEASYDDVTGYSNQHESKHDFFTIGHTSTSISLACGLAKARDVKQEKGNVIAVIGDGSISGGEAYEGLNNAAQEGSNLIIIVNDNEMSIAENAGGVYQNLRALRESKGKTKNNFFEAMGLAYRYIEDGHNLDTLIDVFHEIKDIDHPLVLHVHTVKGKGYPLAEKNKEQWHWGMPFYLATGKQRQVSDAIDYSEFTAQILLKEMRNDSKVIAITSGTPSVFGFDKVRRTQSGKQFIDVGIAEEHAVALASGLASQGAKPVYGVYSTFLQRTYDQLSQDLCINQNPAVLLVFGASVYGMNDVTHLGIFDIACIGNIPNLVYLAPTTMEEYEAMLQWGIHQTKYPVAIRVPVKTLLPSHSKDETDYAVLNRYKLMRKGRHIAIIAVGNFYDLGESVAEHLAKEGVFITLVNPLYISGLDELLLTSLKVDHDLVITLEDGILEGGFGQKIASYYGDSSMKVHNYGIKKAFYDRYDVKDLLVSNGISEEQIIQDIHNFMQFHNK